MSPRPFFTLAFVSIAPLALTLACTSLTTPPEPEEISSATTTTAADLSASAHRKPDDAPSAQPAQPEGKLEVADGTPGKGVAAKAGDTIAVNYVGKLSDGTEFDRSKGKPFTLKLGAGMVIKGWDQGLVGMKVGGKRKLTIPPSLAYGVRGHPPVIPPNSTLVFDVEMVQITPGQ